MINNADNFKQIYYYLAQKNNIEIVNEYQEPYFRVYAFYWLNDEDSYFVKRFGEPYFCAISHFTLLLDELFKEWSKATDIEINYDDYYKGYDIHFKTMSKLKLD